MAGSSFQSSSSTSQSTSTPTIYPTPQSDFSLQLAQLLSQLGQAQSQWAQQVYAQTGQIEKADALFKKTTDISTLSETYMNYANFLAGQGRTVEAREWSQRILAKKPTLPGYLKRRERPWFRKAKGLLKQLPAS